ncbi:MAG: glycosyltransferase family 39 protein [Anaerolineaceae bacterium]|nr:glycosyltransferase family 39 protein [Anaerolineaceae bacterium]
MLTKNRTLFFLILILLLAALVRLVGATSFTVWTDEGWTTWFVHDGDPVNTVIRLLNDRHPPLYFIVLAMWQSVAGNSHLALRLPEIWMGIIGTAVVYRLAADVFDRRVGLYAALLFSVLDVAVYYSQEVRHYGWFMTVGVWTSLTFVRYLRNPSGRRWLIHSLSVVILAYSHYFGVFLMAIQVVFGIFLWRTSYQQKLRLMGAWVFAAVLYLPWLPVVYLSLGSFERGVGGFPGSYGSSLDDFMTLITMLFGGQLALLGSMYLLAVFNMGRWNLERLYLIVTGIGLFAFFFAINESRGVLAPRTVAFLSPPLVVICAYGINLLPLRFQAVVLGVSVMISLIATPNIQPRVNLADSVGYVASQYEPGDLIVQELGMADFAASYEVGQAIDTPKTIASTWVTDPPAFVQEVTPDLEATQRVWVIHWVHAAIVLPRLQDGYLGYQFIGHWTYDNDPAVPIADKEVDVYLFERPLADDPVMFGEVLVLQDAIFSPQQQPDDSLFLDLWWQANEPLGKDYSVAIHLRDAAGSIVAQTDEAIAEQPSSQWAVGEDLHSRHVLAIPADVPPGDYDLTLAVYWYQEPNNPLPTEDGALYSIGQVTVASP